LTSGKLNKNPQEKRLAVEYGEGISVAPLNLIRIFVPSSDNENESIDGAGTTTSVLIIANVNEEFA
jgi:hypothetical protein